MKARGYVTIFVTLLLAVVLAIVTVVLYVSERSYAETKAATSLCSANSSELANYNRMIFDRYHILLFDKNASGQGEGAIEQSIEDSLKYDLGDKFTVDSVELSGTTGITDFNCYEFKRQIKENFLYDAIDYSVEEIISKTGQCDTPVSDETKQEIDADIVEEQEEIEEAQKEEEAQEESETAQKESEEVQEENEASQGKNEEDSVQKTEQKTKISVTDPRDTLKTYTDAGLSILLFPADGELSLNVADMSTLPSNGYTSVMLKSVKTDFQDYDQMMLDSTLADGWYTSLITEAESIVYASRYFNCLTDKKYDDTFFNLELEYLIGGKNTDGGNFKSVVDELLLLRFVMNFAYIVTDPDKLTTCETTAAILCLLAPTMQPIVKYLIAGCWAYIEAVLDVYMLVNGHKVMFLKTKETWRSTYESLGSLDTFAEDSDGEEGLDYKEYLMILLAFHGDSIYYRMLDLMQLNVNTPGTEHYDPTFRMDNAVTAFGVNADVSYEGSEFNLHEEAGY